MRVFGTRHRAGVIEPVESTMKSGPFLTGSGFGVTGCGLCGLDSYSLISCSRKVILGVSWVISGRRYDDGPLPWGIMGVKETSP